MPALTLPAHPFSYATGSTLTPTAGDTPAGARGFPLARGARGPFTPIRFPGAPNTLVTAPNDRGQLVGAYENTAAAPSPRRDGIPPMDRRS